MYASVFEEKSFFKVLRLLLSLYLMLAPNKVKNYSEKEIIAKIMNYNI